jgi:hypothetical protein
MYNNLLKVLINKAESSIVNNQLAACIVKSGKIIGIPRCNAYYHAEASVLNDLKIKKTLNKKNKNYDIFVIRRNKNGTTSNARPCNDCLNLMKENGIRKVYYSVDNNIIINENINDMISIHKSSVIRSLEGMNNTNIYNYYENILKKVFPLKIKKQNLDNFVKYNLNNILPNYKVTINNKNVIITNNNNNIIINANII